MSLADAEYLGDGRPDGTTLGRTATELVSLHGVTPVAQAATIAAITTIQPTVTVFGFTTTAQFNNLIAAVNSILTALKNKGFIAAS